MSARLLRASELRRLYDADDVTLLTCIVGTGVRPRDGQLFLLNVSHKQIGGLLVSWEDDSRRVEMFHEESKNVVGVPSNEHGFVVDRDLLDRASMLHTLGHTHEAVHLVVDTWFSLATDEAK